MAENKVPVTVTLDAECFTNALVKFINQCPRSKCLCGGYMIAIPVMRRRKSLGVVFFLHFRCPRCEERGGSTRVPESVVGTGSLFECMNRVSHAAAVMYLCHVNNERPEAYQTFINNASNFQINFGRMEAYRPIVK